MGVNLFTNIKIKEITKTKVNYSLNEQNLSTKSDQVIIALGAEPKEYLSEELIKLKIKVCTIGDCHNVGYIEGAIMGASSHNSSFNVTYIMTISYSANFNF